MPGIFPNLRTGAVVQFPLRRESRCATEIVRFLDGSEQAYRVAAGLRRRWSVDLSLLDSRELSTLRTFFQEQKGRWGTFQFTDPISGATYDTCSFDDDVFPDEQDADGRNSVSLVIYEHN